MTKKTFTSAVLHLIESNYGRLGGGKKLAELLAEDINELASNFFISRKYIKSGQMVMNVVCKSDKPRVGKRMDETEIKSVVITLITDEEMKEWINGGNKVVLKEKRMARIAQEVFDQLGVVHLGDLALIHLLGISETAPFLQH